MRKVGWKVKAEYQKPPSLGRLSFHFWRGVRDGVQLRTIAETRLMRSQNVARDVDPSFIDWEHAEKSLARSKSAARCPKRWKTSRQLSVRFQKDVTLLYQGRTTKQIASIHRPQRWHEIMWGYCLARVHCCWHGKLMCVSKVPVKKINYITLHLRARNYVRPSVMQSNWNPSMALQSFNRRNSTTNQDFLRVLYWFDDVMIWTSVNSVTTVRSDYDNRQLPCHYLLASDDHHCLDLTT